MANYLSFVLVFVLVSQVICASIAKEENKLEEELQEIHNAKTFVPSTETLHRTIRQAGKQKSPPKKANSGKQPPPTSQNQPEVQARSENTQQQEQSQLNPESNPELGSVQQDQQINGDAAFNSEQRSTQDLQSLESSQQARTHHLLDLKEHKKGHGQEYGEQHYSYVPVHEYPIIHQQPIYQPVHQQPIIHHQPIYQPVHQQPIIHEPVAQPEPIIHQQIQPVIEEEVLQPIVHQKPVHYTQEVIKPIIHEVVKPLPVYHETVKPVYHEVVKTYPVVKEVIKPVPIVKEVIKPYTVPVVHPVQFHNQPTKISVPMQWNCQLVPGAGQAAVSGVQNGYGSYGSYSPAISGGYSSGGLYSQGGYSTGGYSQGLSSGGYSSGLSTGSYSPALSTGSYSPSLSTGSYSQSYPQGGLYGGQAISYSLPLKTLAPKIIGGHGHGLYKSNSNARDSMQDTIEDLIQREELSYNSMEPSSLSSTDMDTSTMSMRSLAQENPQLFARVVDNTNQKRLNMKNNQRSSIEFQQTPQGFSEPTWIRSAQNSQPISFEQVRSSQEYPSARAQTPMFHMKASEQPLSWEQQRSADFDQQNSYEQNMRAAQEQQQMTLNFEQLRSTQDPWSQSRATQNQDPWAQAKSVQYESSPSMQMRSSNGGMQLISANDGMQMRSADNGMLFEQSQMSK